MKMKLIPAHYWLGLRFYVLVPLVAIIGLGVAFAALQVVNHLSDPTNASAIGDPLPTSVRTIKGTKVTVTKKIHIPGKTKTIHGKTVFIPAHTKLVTTSRFIPGRTTVLSGPTTFLSGPTRTVGSTVFQTVTAPGATTVKTVTGPGSTIVETVTGPGSTVTQPPVTVTNTSIETVTETQTVTETVPTTVTTTAPST